MAATAVNTWYTMTIASNPRVEAGEWLQLQVDDDVTDGATIGQVFVYYVELDE